MDSLEKMVRQVRKEIQAWTEQWVLKVVMVHPVSPDLLALKETKENLDLLEEVECKEEKEIGDIREVKDHQE